MDSVCAVSPSTALVSHYSHTGGVKNVEHEKTVDVPADPKKILVATHGNGVDYIRIAHDALTRVRREAI